LERLLYICASVAGFVGVALGAFAAHGLRGRLSAEMLGAFETGVRYQMYHVFALFAAAWAWSRWQSYAFRAAGTLFILGIVLFSGSLYLLAMTDSRWLGMITPLGGLAFLAGWLCLGIGAYRATHRPS
jgi:uncharacterized membrane protein YgdD (TMEM256/DUF423 family)